MAIMNIMSVSVIAEWHKNLRFLNNNELKIPARSPTPKDSSASKKNYPIISKGVYQLKSNELRGFIPCTVPNKMIETMSLNTPSP